MADDGAPRPASNPWRTLETREVYRNPWIRVREDRVVRPNGGEGIYGVVEMHVATGVVALDDEDRVVLVGQWRYPFAQYSWEIIEGGANPKEAPQAAAARELREEAGLGARRWTPLGGPTWLSNAVTDEVAYVFLARDLHPLPAAPDETELLSVRRVPLAEAVRMADEGEIVDAMSIVGLLRAARRLL